MFQNCEYRFERVITQEESKAQTKVTLVSKQTGLAKNTYLCRHFKYDWINSGTKAQQQRNWKSLVREVCVADMLFNQSTTSLTTIQRGDYLLRPLEFIKTQDRCCLISDYPNGPRIIDIQNKRKQQGCFISLDPDSKEPSELSDGYLSD